MSKVYSLNIVHGGNVWKAERKSHRRFDRFLDFSSNINPLGPPKAARGAFLKGFKKVLCYPDPEYIRLRKGLAEFLRVDLSNVFAGNGLSQIIDLVTRSYNFNSAIILNPAYSEYEQACLKSNIPLAHFDMREKEDFSPDRERLYDVLDSRKQAVIFICNPNNPTGTLYPRDFFDGLLKRISKKGHWLIVDEAFIDFTADGRANSLIPLIDKYPRIVVLWSLTKIFSFPGLRLGAAVADKRIIERLRAISPPWSVNIMAEETALVSLRDKAFLENTRRSIGSEREYLFKSLNQFRSLKAYSSEANFFLVKILNKHITAASLSNKLFSRGILIRDCSNFRSLDKFFFRIAVKDRESNKKLVSVLKKYLD